MDKYISALPYLCFLFATLITAYLSFRKWNREVNRILIEIGRIKLSNNIQAYDLAAFIQLTLNEKKKTNELTEEERIFWQKSRQAMFEFEKLLERLRVTKEFS